MELEELLTDKWIYFRFELGLIRPTEKTHEEFMFYCEELNQKILDYAVGQMFMADSHEVKVGWFKKAIVFKGSINKSITAKTYYTDDGDYSIVLRFNEMTEKLTKEIGTGSFKRFKPDDEPREYNFSPHQFIKSTAIIHSIEFALITMFGAKQFDEFEEGGRMILQFHYDESNNPMITETDGIGFCSYPFEKRFKLHLEYPKIENELFGNWKFNDWVKWILSKKGKSEYDREYCINIEKILNKY